MKRKYRSKPISIYRKAVKASASVGKEKNTIHLMSEIDITQVNKQRRALQKLTDNKISLTAYLVYCLAEMIDKYPHFNSFIKGGKIVELSKSVISVLVERDYQGEKAPEPVGIGVDHGLNCLDVHNELKEKQNGAPLFNPGKLGSFIFRLMPFWLLKGLIRLGDRSIKLSLKYGKISVTSIGMFTNQPLWVIPHGSPTVLLSVGSLIPRVIEVKDGYETRDHLCITLSFDHDIIDGAPAARFTNDFSNLVRSAQPLLDLM